MSSNQTEPHFAVRLVIADFYLSSPVPSLDPVYSEFRGVEIQHVPVIRIFGSTSSGKKTCLHVHGVFPYLYVPYTGGEDRDRLAYRLAASLDVAINVSLGSAAARTQHVFKIQLISGMPFYGYHEREHQYFKVYFYNPAMLKRAATLLQNGTVLNQSLQPHEAHIPYVQQFMIDYNLHGMSMVDLRHVRHRLPSMACSDHGQADSLLTENLDYLPSEIIRQSTCQLEVDVLASDILNRQEIERELVLNPGLAAIWEEEKARRLQLGLAGGDSQLVQPQSPSRPAFEPTANDIYQRQRLAQRLLTISQTDESTTPAEIESSYPLETDENSDLINASHLEHHIGPRSGEINASTSKHLDRLFVDQLDVSSSLLKSPEQAHSQHLDCSVLDAADAPLLDILIGLANENTNEPTVDDDSLLGSQRIVTASRSDYDSDDREDGDECADLDLTWLQLESLSWSQHDDCPENTENSKLNLEKVEDVAYDYFRDLSVIDEDSTISGDIIPQRNGAEDLLPSVDIKLNKGEEQFSTSKTFASETLSSHDDDETIDKIPALDGPADLSSDDSDLESDITLERQEKRICDYRSAGPSNQEKIINVTPVNQKRYCREQVTVTTGSPVRNLKKLRSFRSPKNTCRSLASESKALDNPRGHISRSYSPLSIIVSSPQQKSEVRSKNLLRHFDQVTEIEVETDHCQKNDTDEEDVCDITFTQYLNEQSKQNVKFITQNKNSGDSIVNSSRKIVIVPKFNPPNFYKIQETMEIYGIPLQRNEKPFFSNHLDVTNFKEVAHKSLRVPSKCVKDLPQFKSDSEFVTGIILWRAMKVKDVYPSGANIERSKMRQRLASQNKTVIVPLAPAPLAKTLKLVSRAKKCFKQSKPIGDLAADKYKESECLPTPVISAKDEQAQGDKIRSPQENIQPGGETTFAAPDASLANTCQNSNSYNNVVSSIQLEASCGQIQGPSQADNFKIPCQNLQEIKPLVTHHHLTVLCLELHIATRGDLLPDPQHDPIRAIFYAIHDDIPSGSNLKSLNYGIVVCDSLSSTGESRGYLKGSGVSCTISYAASEADLFEHLLSIINNTDPDILVGWELEFLSWGYLFQRAACAGINLAPRVSRIPCTQKAWEIQTTELNILTEIKMPGRIVLDVWRIMRHEIALQSYTFENIMYHVMHQRLSCPSFATLTRWWEYQAPRSRSLVVEHYITKVVGILKIIDQLDILGKTTEFARLYGIQFFEVFSRGSQFQVESVMLRLAKPANYVPVSPSVQQRATMRAPESLPLIMEPESVFYTDPLIVLDFQSLYPSIIIAHNYCFSTCLGRIENMGQSVPFEFGATNLRVTKRTALKLEDKLNFSPCGVAFVKQEVRVGILPRMLTEYLDTRLMVKKAMKDHSQSAHALQRALYSRQRGLKLLANVTFGYTHANFSGRMPCIEIGDSIVSKARETLERAIKVVESTERWNARVVYGDTDSLFVLLPGKSRNQAFEVGAEIASAVTADNPKPMKLKLEKVMQPAILQTKKRYCGYMYESPDQEKPVYLAKGIETVRRDGCPAVSKILEKSLRILFDTKDVSQVKKYVTRQLDKVLRNEVSVQDLTFAKEFRGLQGYKSSACVPALELTRRLILKDPRAIPRTSERVPYVIVAGAPNQPLFQCVRTPWELMTDTALRPNGLYYTTRVIIPPLNRCFSLLGVNVNAWFEAMPHRHTINCNPGGTLEGGQPKSTISQYFGTVACAACGLVSNAGICTECSEMPNQTIVILHEKIRQMERFRYGITAICQSCVGRVNNIECISLDCPVLYRQVRCNKDQNQISYLRQIIEKGNSVEF